MQRPSVLIVDDKSNMVEMLRNVLSIEFDVRCAPSVDAALEVLAASPVDVIVTDIRMPGRTGLELLQEVKRSRPTVEVILMTAYGKIEQAVEAMKAGAFHYIPKPFEPQELVLLVHKALDHKKLVEEFASLKGRLDEKSGFESVIGRSPAMQRVFELMERIAEADSTLLITGETGTGKELIARSIHNTGPRRSRKFVVVHCAALPRDLIESEIFGHLKGAFTGATGDRMGLAEAAAGGTLFLDDINYLPLELQAKVNRLIQEHEVKPVGATQWRTVDVRIIATANVDLKEEAAKGAFREDLYYRLSVLTLDLPPLRERREDIPALVSHFVQAGATRMGKRFEAVDPIVLERLCQHDWPGNIRELRNVIERAMILCQGRRLTADLFSWTDRSRRGGAGVDTETGYADGLERATAEWTRAYLSALLKRFEGNVTKAAKHAGIERQSFHRLMKKHGVRVQREVSAEETG